MRAVRSPLACGGLIPLLISLAVPAPAPAATPPILCAGSATWITSPSIPPEIPGGGTTNCQFHQFAWQAFLDLVQPAAGGERLFETWMPDYGVFQTAGPPTPWGQQPPLPCGGLPVAFAAKHFLAPTGAKVGRLERMRRKDAEIDPPYTQQAGTNGMLYDQAKNLVYYGVWMNQTAYNLIVGCQLYTQGCQSAVSNNTSLALPPGSIEIKTAWRLLPDPPPPNFYTVRGVIAAGRGCAAVTFGLVGFHLVINTPLHPEFIWATFEHIDNDPYCDATGAPPPPPGGVWSFFDPSCPSCPTNQLGTNPTQACRVSPQGGGDTENVQNIIAIDQSMAQLLQQAGPDMAVWANYELTGNLWTTGEIPPSPSNERGSLSNANTTMETFAQPSACFDCHSSDSPPSQFLPSGTPLDFSHMFGGTLQGGGCPGGQLPPPPACPAPPPVAFQSGHARQ